jgi:mannose-1-phosphate guanylyltransferase
MLEDTVARVGRFTDLDRAWTVVGRAHADTTRKLLAHTAVKTLVEPVGRNTAACIGLAALHVKRISPDEPMVVLPADHFIADVERFAGIIRAAAEVARTGAILTLGIAPTKPETGYGYIQIADEMGRSSGHPYFVVKRFVEKPDYQTALGYLSEGNYLWNSGIFIFTPRTILSEFETCLPDLYQGLIEIEKSMNQSNYDAVVERVYTGLSSISIDYGVMEKTKKPILVFKADFGWSDVGSWQALYELRRGEYDDQGNLLMGETLIADSRGNLVYSGTGRQVALLGVEGLVVVDTPDALMVADLDRSQDVKQFPEMLKRKRERVTQDG